MQRKNDWICLFCCFNASYTRKLYRYMISNIWEMGWFFSAVFEMHKLNWEMFAHLDATAQRIECTMRLYSSPGRLKLVMKLCKPVVVAGMASQSMYIPIFVLFHRFSNKNKKNIRRKLKTKSNTQFMLFNKAKNKWLFRLTQFGSTLISMLCSLYFTAFLRSRMVCCFFKKVAFPKAITQRHLCLYAYIQVFSAKR